MVNKCIFFILVQLTSFFTRAQNIEWVNHINPSSSWNAGSNVSMDFNQNVYVTGVYNGSSQVGNTVGSFLNKYDSLGTIVWQKNLSGAYIYGSHADTAGYIFITGRFGGTVYFGNNAITGSGWDFFIAKYDGAGNCLWVKQAGQATGNVLKCDKAGNVYVTGTFGGNCTFGAFTLTQSNSGVMDFFIVKYNSAGQCIWAKQTNGGISGNGGDLDVNDSFILITDNYSLPIIFAQGNNSTTLTTHGGSAFVAKYDIWGNFIWAKQITDSGQCQSKGIVIDQTGNAFVSGWYSNKVKFENVSLTCNYTNAFLGKYDPNGILQWIKQPANQSGYGYKLAINNYNSLYLATSLENAGVYTDVIKYDVNGNEKWRKGHTSQSPYTVLAPYGIASTNKKVLLTGEFSGSIYFDSYNLNKSPNGADRDAFALQITDSDFGPTAGLLNNSDGQDKLAMKLYPNPTDGIIHCSLNFETKNAVIHVRNILSQLVIENTKLSGTNILLDISQLPRGVYFIEIKSEQGSEVKKLVLE